MESFFPSSPKTFGDVRVDRQRGPEGLEDDDLLRSVGDVVVSADHVGDLVDPVVHGRGEVVDRPAVGTEDDHVLELGRGELDPALDGVVPADDALVRHPDPDRAVVLVRLAFRDEPRRLSRQRSAPSSWNRVAPSHSIPSQRSERSICSTDSATSRPVSVFSIRSRHSPPRPRAKSQLKRNVRTPPMWRNPVGLGAMRTRTLIRRRIVVLANASPRSSRR